MKLRLGRYEFVIRTYRPPSEVSATRANKPKAPPKPNLHISPGALQVPMSEFGGLIHLGDGLPGSVHMYAEWREHFLSSGIKNLAIFRHFSRYQEALTLFPNDPLVFAKGSQDVDFFVKRCTSAKVCYVTTLTGNALTIMRYDSLRPVFIGHGDSDKVSSSRRAMRAFDEIWVAGEAHRDRLQPILKGVRARVVGRPQVLSLMETGPAESVRGAYLPTWEGILDEADYSSLQLAPQIIDAMRVATPEIWLKLHPSTGSRRSEYQVISENLQSTDVTVFDRASSAIAIMRDAAFCVADTSSIVSDWLVTGRPLFLFESGRTKLATKTPPETYAYIFRTSDELKALIKEVIVDKNDYLSDSRIMAADYLISADATKNKEFHNAVRSMAGV